MLCTVQCRPASACARKSPSRGCTLKKQDKTRQDEKERQHDDQSFGERDASLQARFLDDRAGLAGGFSLCKWCILLMRKKRVYYLYYRLERGTWSKTTLRHAQTPTRTTRGLAPTRYPNGSPRENRSRLISGFEKTAAQGPRRRQAKTIS